MRKLSKLIIALSFVVSVTSSAIAVTVASWGGAYTDSQKQGYGDPTAAALGVDINWVDYSGGLSEIKAQKEAVLSPGILSVCSHLILSMVATKVYLLNLILTKTSQQLQTEHLQVKTFLLQCQVSVQ